MNENELIEIDEEYYVREAVYRMPYHELDDIRAFVRSHEWGDIPDYIKDHIEKWEEFLIDNL